ncbi:MAG: bifunctional nuclease family protein [Simkaniaceae bacterium]|nr:bifunctional nuclease family protein [Simkaniaceae bacterium]
MELIELNFKKIMQSKGYTAFILGNDQKHFAIYTQPEVGENIQRFMQDEKSPRPQTHDLIKSLFVGLDISPLQVVIHDVQDSIYTSRLFLEQQQGDEKKILEIDARPSDALTVALMNNLPIYCRREVMEKSIEIST